MKSFSATATVTPDHQLVVPAPMDLAPGAVEVVVVLGSAAANAPHGARTIDVLGWTPQEAAETRARLASFEDDWNAPGMEVYDDVQPR